MSSSDLLRAFELQVEWCRKLDANFTGDVVDTLAGSTAQQRASGRVATRLARRPDCRRRTAAAVRRPACTGARWQSTACCASTRPRQEPSTVRRWFGTLNAALGTSRSFLERMLKQPPQTNEIGRSAVLLGGFAEIAESTRLPLALLEIGASAGLNLHWDRYRFDLGDVAWGDPAFAGSYPLAVARCPAPFATRTIRVASRAGCDKAPLDPRSEADRRNLLAYVWPEQLERVARLSAALDLAQANGFAVDRADAADWVASPSRSTQCRRNDCRVPLDRVAVLG